MKTSRAEPIMPLPSADGPVTTPYGVLSWTQVWELSLPGVVIGVITGLIAGGLTAAAGLSVAVVLVTTVSLGLPVAAVGGWYELLLARGKAPLGTLGPMALVWAIAFPPIRVVNAALTDLVAGDSVAVPHGWAAFIAYQVLVAVPFAIGYWWLHENFAARWWFHIRKRNPVADQFVRVQLQYAESAEIEKERQSQRREAKRAKRLR
jgi:hypothetical protein